MGRLQSVQPFAQRQAHGDQPAQRWPEVASPYLTAKQAVEFLQLPSEGALYHHIRENRLPHGRIGRRYRFDRRELEAWMAGYGSALEMSRRKVSA